jgi:FkbM family methyltransferase
MNLAEFTYSVLLKPKPLRAGANRLLRALSAGEVRRHGARIVLNREDPVVSGALTLGVYERDETRFFLRQARPGMQFVDIGANVGYYTALALSRMNGKGRIVAFEPDPVNFAFLEKTVRANHGEAMVTCLAAAAGDRAAEMTLHVNADNRGDNRLYANELGSAGPSVRVGAADDLLEQAGLEAADLIKVDVQGWEGHVFRGLERTMGRSADIVILSEFWPRGLRMAGTEPRELLDRLRRQGLRLFELTGGGSVRPIEDDQRLVERLKGRQYANIVAARGRGLDLVQ